MSPEHPQEPPLDGAALPQIDSRAAFAAAVRWGATRAVEAGARRIVCVDRDFCDWPLDDAALLDTLTGWVRRPQRHLVLLAASYDEMALRHPRFTAWRRLWAHAVAPWQAPPDVESRLPTLLLDDGAVMIRVFDSIQWRGRVSLDAQVARPYRDEIDAVLQRSEPAFPAMRLGL